MKRVYIAIALALSMLLGSTAFAGGKSLNVQFDASFISVGWSNGHYQRGNRHYRQPQHWQQRRVQRYRHAPRRIYRPAPRRHYRHAPRQHYRPAPRHHFKRYVPRYNRWHQQKRRQWRKH